MENADIAKIFYEIAGLLEIKGENPFRVRSYRNAGLTVEGLPVSVKFIAEKDEKSLEDIPGIGKSIHEKIVELLKTGKCGFHDELLRELPPGLLQLLDIRGLGPKKVKALYDKLGITDVDVLEKAIKEGRLRGLPGFAEKTESNVLKAIGDYRKLREGSKRFRLSTAYQYAKDYAGYMKKLPGGDDPRNGVANVEIAGSLRRWKETIGDADILVTCKDAAKAAEHFVKYPEVKEIIAKGGTKSTVVLKAGLQVDLRVLDKKSFGAALQYFTGSKAHNIAVRDRAKKMGLKVSEYGVFSEKTGKILAGESEEEVYRAVGLCWIPPELRENSGEIEAAEKNKLPKLIELKDIKGDLHVHTKASDGSGTIEEMAWAAMKRGYEYIAITDHSRAVGIAHGLDEKRLLKQIEEIDEINRRLGKEGKTFGILKGTEVDIRADGTLDFHPDMLKKLDCVVAAVHSGFDMSEDAMTGRIIKAMSSGFVNVLAHPTGRLIGRREPYRVDMEKIFEAAKKYGVFLELNSYPERLDLSDVHTRLAKERGVPVAISTDSHSPLQLDYALYGVHTARRGWLTAKDVVNTRRLKDLYKLLRKL